MIQDALLEKTPKSMNTLALTPEADEYVPTPEALRLAYSLANPTKKMLTPAKYSKLFGIPKKVVSLLMQDKRFLRFVSELVPTQSDILLVKAYKRLNKEMGVSPYVKGNKGVEASKIVLQVKGHIKPNQTNILNADLNLESVLDALIQTKKEKVVR